jgi:hypothetical protein
MAKYRPDYADPPLHVGSANRKARAERSRSRSVSGERRVRVSLLLPAGQRHWRPEEGRYGDHHKFVPSDSGNSDKGKKQADVDVSAVPVGDMTASMYAAIESIAMQGGPAWRTQIGRHDSGPAQNVEKEAESADTSDERVQEWFKRVVEVPVRKVEVWDVKRKVLMPVSVVRAAERIRLRLLGRLVARGSLKRTIDWVDGDDDGHGSSIKVDVWDVSGVKKVVGTIGRSYEYEREIQAGSAGAQGWSDVVVRDQ